MLYFILKDQLMKQTKALIMHRESSFNMTRGGGGDELGLQDQSRLSARNVDHAKNVIT